MADSNVCMREHLQAIAAHGVVCKFAFNMLKLSVAAGCAVWLVCAICQWERGTFFTFMLFGVSPSKNKYIIPHHSEQLKMFIGLMLIRHPAIHMFLEAL